MNNIYYDYIGAKGSYEINDYIDNVSNVLNNKIDLTSNFLDTKIINLDNKYNNLINTSNTSDFINGFLINVDNTYIYNNNQYGEIRFKTQINNNNYYVKIGRDGRLYLWISYNIIRPEILEGWYEVSDILADYFFNLAIINFTLAGYGADLLFLQTQITTINTQILSIVDLTFIHTVQINKLIELQEASLVDELLNSTVIDPVTAYQQITARGINSVSRISTSAASLVGLGGLGLFSWIATGTYGYFSQLQEEIKEKKLRLNNIYGELLTNSGTSNLDVVWNEPGMTLRQLLYQDIYSNLSNLNNYEIIQEKNKILSLGFINSNITTSQLIPKITTYEITYNGVEISTTLNNYLQKDGGTMTGRLNFNYGANFGTPVGGGGGSGERINLNTNGITATDFPPSLGVSGNSLWFSSPVNHSYQWFNNGNQLMSLTSSGQLILNNPITTAERQYPPKAYTSSTNESVITFLGQSGILSSTITLNPIGITYGSGVYEIYSSSRYNPSEYQKRDLFNYATTTNEVGGHWAGGQYSSIGVYQGVAYIKPDYLGDFLVVKLPNLIILTKFRFYPRLGFNHRIPGEFKFYGSMNNIDYTEITQASQITPRLTTNDIINGYYEKTLAAGFNTPYLYIGFTVNKLIGTTNPDCINFKEFEIYGKEVLSSTASLAIGTSDASTYALNVNGVVNASSYIGIGSSLTTLDYNNITLNKPLIFPPDPTAVQTTILTSTPNVSKKYMLQFTCTTPFLMPNGITYYKYDIDLRNYTQTKIINNPNTPYRIFKIKLWIASGYYEYLYNGNYNVLSYEVFMSNQSQGGGGGIGSAGINLRAIGTPENPILNGITPTQISLVRSADFNFICCLAIVNNTQVYSIIEDCLF